MDTRQLNEVIAALNKKQVNQPCPRCLSNNFSIVGESEILVARPPSEPKGLLARAGLSSLPSKITMPIIIVTCDNCGYVSQHAKAALVPTRAHPASHGLTFLGGGSHE